MRQHLWIWPGASDAQASLDLAWGLGCASKTPDLPWGLGRATKFDVLPGARIPCVCFARMPCAYGRATLSVWLIMDCNLSLHSEYCIFPCAGMPAYGRIVIIPQKDSNYKKHGKPLCLICRRLFSTVLVMWSLIIINLIKPCNIFKRLCSTSLLTTRPRIFWKHTWWNHVFH